MKNYKAVFFDAGETLLSPHPSFEEVFVAAMRDEGFEVELPEAKSGLESGLEEAFKMLPDLENAAWSTSREASSRFWGTVYRTAVDRLGIVDPEDRFPGIMYERFTRFEVYRLFPDAIPAIERIRGSGRVVGLISNFEEWLEGMLIEWEVHHLFDQMVISGKEGIEKPDPKIFRAALERTGMTAEESLYVGDNPLFDIDAAGKIGMDGVLIDRRNRYPDFTGAKIKSLEELPALVGITNAPSGRR